MRDRLEYNRRWRAENRDKVRGYARARRKKGGEELRRKHAAYLRKWRAEDRDARVNAPARRRYAEQDTTERRRLQANKRREWRAKNVERARETERRYREANREQLRVAKAASNRKVLYGLTREAFLALVADQQGLCLICRGFYGLKLHVDHDHATGNVRGLLCGNCNTALGLLGEAPDRFAAAVAYLKQAA
jgi:hypothetical protein